MLLFTYGTLKRGGKYHDYLQEASLVAEHAIAKGALYDTGLGYPAMIPSDSEETTGEIYEVPDVLWPALDFLEDYAGNPETDLYDKITIQVRTGGKTVEVLAYVAKAPELLKTKIEDGHWQVEHAVQL